MKVGEINQRLPLVKQIFVFPTACGNREAPSDKAAQLFGFQWLELAFEEIHLSSVKQK